MGGRLYVYLMYFVAALGFAVAVGQLYIHSIMDKVLVLGRKELYRGMAWAQLLFSLHLGALSFADFVNRSNVDNARALRNLFLALSLWWLWWSVPAMLWAVNALVAPRRAVDAPQEAEQEFHLGWVGASARHTREAARVLLQGLRPWMIGLVRWLYRGMWWLLLLGALLAAYGVAHGWIGARWGLPDPSGWAVWGWPLPDHLFLGWGASAAERSWVWQAGLGLLWLALALSLLRAVQLLWPYARVVILSLHGQTDPPVPVNGFALFAALTLGFAWLPLLQALQSWCLNLGGAWAVWGSVGLGWGLLWAAHRHLRGLGVRLQAVPNGVGAALGSYGREAVQATAWVLMLFAACSLPAYPLAVWAGLDVAHQPWWGVSYLLLVLACNYMAANDLRHATAEADALRAAQLDARFINQLAHELHNGLLPVRNLLLDDSVREFQRNGQPFEATLPGQLWPLARQGLQKAEALLDQVKRNGVFPVVRLVPQDPRPLIERFAQTYWAQLQAAGNLIPVHAQLGAGTGVGWSVAIDPTVFETVLRILVDNAVQAKAPGRDNVVTIGCLREGENLHIDISDCGGGMTPEVRERFGQVQTSTKLGGTGLGTKIAQDMAAAMAGQLQVLSSDQNGTIIRWSLPVASRVAAGLRKTVSPGA